jgi:pimeloyl-ACP methyl ester carboxylesterase
VLLESAVADVDALVERHVEVRLVLDRILNADRLVLSLTGRHRVWQVARRVDVTKQDAREGIALFLSTLDEPEPLIGLHLTNLELTPYTGPGSRPLSAVEQTYLAQAANWDSTERGYTAIQSTKPQTLAYALNDSPAGLAAWIVEKWRAWSDSGGHLESRFSREYVLTMVTLFWVTQTMPTSMRDYFDNRRWQGEPLLGPDDFVGVPTGIAHFPHMFVPEGNLPREWAERLYNVTRWTAMASGGHFAAAEEPDLVARDITTFFADIAFGRMS